VNGAFGDRFLSDIFREVDEEVRREQMKRLWERYSIFIIAAAVLLVAAIGAWRAYEYWEGKKAAEAGARFDNALTLADQGKHAEAEAEFSKLSKESPSGYKTLSRFAEAAQLAQRDPKAAITAYDAIASDNSLPLLQRDLAGIRAGLLMADNSPYAELQRRLEPLTAGERPFRHTARELLAFSAWRSGDAAAARRWYEMMTTDSDTPASTRSRVEVLMALLPEQGRG
jgi:hypothetical protein